METSEKAKAQKKVVLRRLKKTKAKKEEKKGFSALSHPEVETTSSR